jgi:dTDP-4-amino-4,6-dideoxygalactose transaminase
LVPPVLELVYTAYDKGNPHVYMQDLVTGQRNVIGTFDGMTFARRHGLTTIEDAACALGTEYRGRKAGTIGRIGCFSFHPRKAITTGEGGMLTTASAEWDRLFRMWRQHGMDIAASARHHASAVVFESYPVEGFNYRLTDLQAAIGRKQLERLSDIIGRRRRLADRYKELLGGSNPVCVPVEPAWSRSNWQSYCVRLPDHVAQREVMQALLDRGISTRRGIMCAHREPPYAGRSRHPLPESEVAQDRCILLPLFPQMTGDEQEQVANAVRQVCAG